MFQNRHPVHFLTHYLNTSVFGTLTQTQFSTLIPRAISSFYSLAATAVSNTAASIAGRLKIDREQIHYYIGG